jgi:hypothetical protein
MSYRLAHPIALICAFTWVGFVCAISFMEAWLKFRAAGVTLPVGLGIGRLVFQALNKVEWVLAIAIVVDLLWKRQLSLPLAYAAVPVVILIIQTAWLLPALDVRAMLTIHGQAPGPSNLHFIYVAFEAIKVGALMLLGIKLFLPNSTEG